MAKKCIICNKDATYQVKDTADYYCADCAEEYFGDVALLIKVEEDAQKLREILKNRLENGLNSDKEEPEE